MASTYTDIGTELMTTGENASTWGTKTNTNLKILEEAIRGYVSQSIAGSAQTTALTYTDGTTGDSARQAVVELSGTITGNQVVTVTAKEKWWVIKNSTSGAYTVQVMVSGQTGVTWATTDKGAKILYCNGTDVIDTNISSNELTSGTGDITLDSAADIVIDAAGGNIEFKDAGTTQLLLDMDTTSGAQIVQLKVNSDDLVFQQYDGNEVVRIADDRRLYFYDKGGEYIYGDGTDLHIVSGADVNLSANIGLTFGDDGEKIEGDGTDLTITGNTINLTATTDVALAVNTGLLLAGTEKIESDGTDLSITVGGGGDINIGTDIGLTFGNDGEKIEGDGTDLTITGNTINLTATTDVALAVNTGLLFAGTEKIESDGTDLSITVGSSGDINIGADIGLTFGDDGEKIEGDGTDLTIASSAALNLTATTDVVILANVGITFGTGEKIEGDSTNLTITSGADIALTATADVNLPNDVGMVFGDDGEKIEGDGTDLTIASSAALNLTATTDVVIPANVGVTFGSGEKIEGDSTDLTITSGAKINLTATSDIVVPADVGITFGTGEKIEGDSTDLTVTSGGAINLTATTDVVIPNSVGIVFGGASEKIEGDGTDLVISANNLTVDAAADIILDAAGNNVIFKSGGTSILDISNSSSDAVITASVQDKDIIFKGDDGGAAITSLTLDMSAGGIATFSAAANVAQAALTSSSNAVAWDASDKPNAYHLTTENTTLSAPTNAVEGAFICIEINFDGSHTFSWNAIFNFAADTAPTTTDTNAITDILVFRYNGAIWQEVGRTLNIPES